MADDKAFEPTAARLSRAKREGDVPTSQSLNVIGALAFASLVLFVALGPMSGAAAAALTAAAHGTPSVIAYAVLLGCALAIPSAAAVGATLTTLLQTRRIAFKAPTPKFEKLNPAEGLKKMFSKDAAIGGAKALTVALTVACAIVPAVQSAFGAGASGGVAAELAALTLHAIAAALACGLAAAALFAVFDVLIEQQKWKKRLRMSFDEIKREHKQSEGDPQLRGRRRQAHRALIRGSIGRLKEAAFVVCNPTHVAIALAYRPPEIAVPQVLLRGIDEGAHEIKRRARELRVPIVENVALARALLAATATGDYIPPDTYGAVAAIVASLVREGAVA